MGLFADLWLPIAVSAGLVFIASSVLHMLIPVHKGDYRQLPNESEVLAAMRRHGVPPGAYSFPFPTSMKDMASPEMIAKYQEGPVGLLTVLPTGVPTIAKSLGLWFLYCVLQSVFVGYLAMLALSWGATGMEVFRVTGTAALLGYAIPHLHDAIWKGQSWITTGKYLLDGVIYSLVTSTTFVLLWPTVP